MTMHEKKINKVDLHSYKNLEGNMYALVPGMHHVDTVSGTKPLAHKGAPAMDLDLVHSIARNQNHLDFNNSVIRDNNSIYKRKQQELDRKRQGSQDGGLAASYSTQ
mmetsp:Transcript_48985/g.36072  ORF Transcript_48985/g.36072 Transcript_48985/m.36072 type:complete len:106 (+) Transcript_48985:1106-1423(+)